MPARKPTKKSTSFRRLGDGRVLPAGVVRSKQVPVIHSLGYANITYIQYDSNAGMIHHSHDIYI